ncbi:outer membrane beta-barrel protein [uncultured Alsobacter sp.]|uniref:outer membrane protein n=1 Tax=uncultured Alsobacter sp. TaxID=1748258 RepID=UPI0025FA5EAD|nr:outer membrane beta-barrel protein [uncultured Alsobacter sp.]
MKALRTIALLAVAAFAGTDAARAADLPRRTDPYAPAPSYAPSLSNWQGFYVGGHLGGGFGKAGPVDTSGLLGGAHAGVNVQYDRFVVGAEGDFTFSGVGNNSFTERARHDWLASIRGRGGYSFGNILAYGTLGFAFADVNYRSILGRASDTTTGWAIGFGAEMMVTPNVTIRAEYLRYELGSTTYPSAIGPVQIDSSVNVIRAGASYKF